MTPEPTTPTHGSTTTGRLVAGVDLLTESERDADALLHQAVRRLSALEAASGAVLATHWARACDIAHVALSVELPCADSADHLWELLDHAFPAAAAGSVARCVGKRRSGPIALQLAAESAARAHLVGASGRAVHFPGVGRLVGTVTVNDVLAWTSIDAVRVLAQGAADPEARLVTRDFVRPRWSAGRLVLDVQPAVGGTLVPFEVPAPTPCCAGGH